MDPTHSSSLDSGAGSTRGDIRRPEAGAASPAQADLAAFFASALERSALPSTSAPPTASVSHNLTSRDIQAAPASQADEVIHPALAPTCYTTVDSARHPGAHASNNTHNGGDAT